MKKPNSPFVTPHDVELESTAEYQDVVEGIQQELLKFRAREVEIKAPPYHMRKSVKEYLEASGWDVDTGHEKIHGTWDVYPAETKKPWWHSLLRFFQPLP